MPARLKRRAWRPRLLDIGCCQGGAAFGYQRAGWHVTGVDTMPQPKYCGDDFIQADGLEVLADLDFVSLFDGVHTSWPCQGYALTQRIMDSQHPRLISRGRELLRATGLPYVQENVEEAAWDMIDPIRLCGASFGLHTYRHRLFESNIRLLAPAHTDHVAQAVKMGRPVRTGDWYYAVGNFSDPDQWIRKDLGMPWMNRDGLRESVPWQYTRMVGQQMLAFLAGRLPLDALVKG
jgi:DNA (cytosine-5)-methyltransferase 1